MFIESTTRAFEIVLVLICFEKTSKKQFKKSVEKVKKIHTQSVVEEGLTGDRESIFPDLKNDWNEFTFVRRQNRQNKLK